MCGSGRREMECEVKKIAFIDLEVGGRGKILDLGAIKGEESFHSAKVADFVDFIGDCEYLCGHNIIEHDLTYLRPFLKKNYKVIDTLYLSPLLFPMRPYHRLLKDDKIDSEELNNPLNDAMKARILYEDEADAFGRLPESLQLLYHDLTSDDIHFSAFFKSVNYSAGWRPSFLRRPLSDSIRAALDGIVCECADIERFARKNGVECAYATAVILTRDRNSITPAWVLKNYPAVEKIIYALRSRNCGNASCEYCSAAFNPERALKKWFGYEHFRKFNGEPLQENAVRAAMGGESLLAIFPTGGGKSLTFQLPALVAGETVRGLTIVISPLQSLMKDQVENLERKGISDAVYINGLLSPVERRDALERVRNGEASMLYIAPEQLRSKTIEKILMSRTVSRFVIDEAHCFSAWGQDFRIEYLHIADFIKSLQEAKGLEQPIPVSCFTATAKPKVISDITDYFQERLGLRLRRFTTDATRTNLHYTVLYRANNEEKYQTLRDLLIDSTCPAIVYVTRTKAAEDLAARLVRDGLDALAFHGQMETRVKVQNQDDFINDRVRIIVATSAFGMGVDKSDVGLVVHYEISDSLENYIQEAGRAGRDVHSEADCYVLYNDDDLNRHFILLNQTKLTFSEINQVWRAIKGLTQKRDLVCISALEVARKAGWDEIRDVETKVKSAVAALENAGYVRRGMNSPRIFATSIAPKNLDEASQIICSDDRFAEEERQDAVRIIKSLISERSRARAGTAEAESRIDYLSDMLGIETGKVVRLVEKMQLCGILAKDEDMTAYPKVYNMLENFRSCPPVIALANSFARTIGNRLKSEPVRCVVGGDGRVRLVRHPAGHYGQAVVDEILAAPASGSSAVLTMTNDDALMVSAMLGRRGVKARLIQSNDSFNLHDLAELHLFYSDIRANCSTIIPDNAWSHAKELMTREFAGSSSLEIALSCIGAFEKEYPSKRYVSDLFNFFGESELSDFCKAAKNEVVVSTVHKSKGREFDNVYLLLRGMAQITDRERRVIYVGITRAKTNLSVHFDGGIFRGIPELAGGVGPAAGLSIENDSMSYAEPDELLLQLSHRDLHLDCFKGKSDIISKLRSGDALNVIDDRLYTTVNGYSQQVGRFSEAFRTKLSKLQQKGYVPTSSRVSFLLFWHHENPDKTDGAPKHLETPIVLPEIRLVSNSLTLR